MSRGASRSARFRRALTFRVLLSALSALLTAVMLFSPTLRLPRDAFRYQFVIDITQSMNARDYHLSGYPEDRLGFVKASLAKVIEALPCGSEVGLGLFTTQSVHFLFDPIEVCQHLPVIQDTLRHVDWRMAWSADSHVEFGLYHALRSLQQTSPSTRLVFLTDGQETPPQTVEPQYDSAPGTLLGLLVGVGGTAPVSVPRYDRDNLPLGIWENADIERPPLSTNVYTLKTETRTLPTEGPYLSFLDVQHLQKLSAITGLPLVRLTTPEALLEALSAPALAEKRAVITDLRPALGLVVLGLFLSIYLIERRAGPPRARG